MDLAIELSAVIVTVKAGDACVLCLNLPGGAASPAFALPSGPFVPQAHRTFDLALRAFVGAQTGFDIGYVEQLYSFGDEGRQAVAPPQPGGERIVSIGYLALTPQGAFQAPVQASWVPFQRFFPWEDWRSGHAALDALRAPLQAWSERPADAASRGLRRRRVETLFPVDADHWADHWNEERVLDRYELLYDAGLVAESGGGQDQAHSGEAMASDHRRIVATGLSRLRGKVKYRPVIFELMPGRFTLSELQKSLEGIAGLRLHKQNFRRALERTGFVQPLGEMREDTGGRPAELYAYDRDRYRFSPSLGLSLPRA